MADDASTLNIFDPTTVICRQGIGSCRFNDNWQVVIYGHVVKKTCMGSHGRSDFNPTGAEQQLVKSHPHLSHAPESLRDNGGDSPLRSRRADWAIG